MLSFRRALVVLLLLGVTGFALPGFALAACGGSASGSQYCDPFGSSKGGTTTKKPTTTSAPTSNAAPPAATPPAASTPATAPATTGTGPSSTTGAPTATTAATTSTGAHGKTLPFTGYDGRLAALLGAALVLGGAGLRIRFRRT